MFIRMSLPLLHKNIFILVAIGVLILSHNVNTTTTTWSTLPTEETTPSSTLLTEETTPSSTLPTEETTPSSTLPTEETTPTSTLPTDETTTETPTLPTVTNLSLVAMATELWATWQYSLDGVTFVVTCVEDASKINVTVESGSNLTARCTSLIPGRLYEVTVVASRLGYADSEDAEQFAVTKPLPVTNLTAVNISHEEATLTWTNPSRGGHDVTQITVAPLSSSSNQRVFTLNSSSASLVLSDLVSGRIYSVAIVTGVNVTMPTNTQSEIVYGATTRLVDDLLIHPPPIVKFEVKDVTEKSVALEWMVAAGEYEAVILSWLGTDVTRDEARVGTDSLSNETTTYNVTGLESGRSYVFTIMTSILGVNGTEKENTTLTNPKPLTNLRGSSITEGSATFKWTNPSSGGHGYTRIVLEPGAIAVVVPASLNSTTVSRLTPGETYNVSGWALVNGSDTIRTSSVSEDSVIIKPAPLAPSNITIVPSARQVAITIEDVTGKWDRFEVSWTPSNSQNSNGPLNFTTKNFNISHLEPAKEYNFNFTVVSRSKRSAPVFKSQTTQEAPPSEPKNLAVTTRTDESVTLKWEVPKGNVLNYQITYYGTGSTERSAINTTNLTYIVTGLSVGTSYTFEVVANNMAGAGVAAKLENIWTNDGPSGPAEHLNVSHVQSDKLTVIWRSPGQTNGRVFRYYVVVTKQRVAGTSQLINECVQLKNISCTNCDRTCDNITTDGKAKLKELINEVCSGKDPQIITNFTLGASFFEYEMSGLDAATKYTLTVIPINRAGNGTKFQLDSWTGDAKSSSVKNLTVSPESSTALKAAWKKPVDPKGLILEYLVVVKAASNAACVRYYLFNCTNCATQAEYKGPVPDGTISSQIAGCNQASTQPAPFSWNHVAIPEFSINQLEPYRNYTVYVYPINSKGLGDQDSKMAETQQSAPGSPSNITITPTFKSLTITWNPPIISTGVIAQYVVYVTPVSGGNSKFFNTTADNRAVIVPGLTACTHYNVNLSAETGAGHGAVESRVVRTTANVPGTVIVSDIKVVAASNSSLSVTWSALAGEACHITYEVQWKKSNPPQDTNMANITSDMSTATIPALAIYTPYVVRICAIADGSARGNCSSWTTPVLTMEGAPGAVASFSCIQLPRVFTSLTCNWTEPATKNGIVTSYKITYTRGTRTVSADTRTTYSNVLTENIFANETIVLSIVAITGGGEGIKEGVSVVMKPGPPAINPNAIATEILKPDEFSLSTLRVGLPYDFVLNSHGAPEFYTLVVSTKSIQKGESYPTAGMSPSEPYGKTWKQTEGGVKDYYEVVVYNNTPSTGRRRKRAVSDRPEKYTLGKDACNEQPNTEHCNGALHADTAYQIAFRAYTGGGSFTSEPIEARTSPTKSPIGLIVGVVVGFLCLLALAIVIAFFVMKKRRKNDHSNNIPLDPVPPVPPHTLINRLRRSLRHSVHKRQQHHHDRPPQPVPIHEFPAYVVDLGRDSDRMYGSQFELIKALDQQNRHKMKLTTRASEAEVNRLKNRYSDIKAYDQTRVKLVGDENADSGADYINANYLPGSGGGHREFIACQGPLVATLDDFWQMIWEKEVPVIVMLTRCVERGRVKCEQYWPDVNETRNFGENNPISVRVFSESVQAVYTLRVFEMTLGGESRHVSQLHMLKWEDRTAPNVNDFNDLLTGLHNLAPRPRNRPIVVHCSAGVGRTGTLILIDNLMDQIANGDTYLDIFSQILEMRKCRPCMIQTEQQYIFVHSFMLHYLQTIGRLGANHCEEDPDHVYENWGKNGAVFQNDSFVQEDRV